MKIVGLIAEYNPFHNGHRYHIEQAKKITGADHAVVVMSGDYVQRGIPACMPKRLRAEMALKCGASAVFELPVCYATGSAELFAEGAVSLLDRLGIVDTLVFGSECNRMSPRKRLLFPLKRSEQYSRDRIFKSPEASKKPDHTVHDCPARSTLPRSGSARFLQLRFRDPFLARLLRFRGSYRPCRSAGIFRDTPYPR